MTQIQAVVAYTLSPPEHAIVALRITGPLRAAGIEVIWGNHGADIDPSKVLQADAVVLQRDFPRHIKAYNEILRLARANAKPVLLDMDDLLLELPDDHPDRLSDYYAGALLPMLLAVLQVDGLTVSTPRLGEYLRALNPNVWVLPNYYNDQIWRLLPPKSPAKSKQPIVIGYMGGDSHKPDLDMIRPVLERLLKAYPEDLEMRFLGVEPPGELAHHPRVGWTPLSLPDYPKFADLLLGQDWDICIAPLKDNLFNHCKSAVKFFEYTSLGIPGAYSRVTPFESVILHGECGFLAETLDEWESYLKQLIESPTLRQGMAQRAQESIRADWSLENHAHQWPAAYQECAAVASRTRSEKRPDAQALVSILAQSQEWQDRLLGERDQKVRSEDGQPRGDSLGKQLATQLQEKEQIIQGLKAELENIYGSNGWAYLQKFMQLRRRLLPEGGRGERFLQGFLKLFK